MNELKIKYDAFINEAEKIAGHSVKVVAVTKTFPISLWHSCLEQGIVIVGENKIQDARKKIFPIE